MFGFFYSNFASLAVALLKIVGPYIRKFRELLVSRKNAQAPASGKRMYWIHCASLGEYEMAIPLIEKILERQSLKDLIITFFSPSGYKQAKKGRFGEAIAYLPFDTLKNVEKFYKYYAPSNAIFVRYDFWYNFIKEGLRGETKFYLINGRFTQNHFIFKYWGRPYQNLLKQFSCIFLSDKLSENVLNSNGFSNWCFTGDTRYDRVAELVKNADELASIQQFKGNRKLLVLGSSWQQEEVLTLNLASKLSNELAILIAPHDINRSNEIAQKFSEFTTVKYSEWDKNIPQDILIIDNIGMLSRIYRYADFALVGGGFSGKLHNILEPAVWGCPIFFGPKIEKFAEAMDAVSAGFGFTILDENDFCSQIENFLNNENGLEGLKLLSQTFTSTQIGASQIIYDQIVS